MQAFQRRRRPGGKGDGPGRPGAVARRALRESVVAGLGLVLLPCWPVGDDLEEGRLRDQIPGWRAAVTGQEAAAWLVYPSRAFPPARTRSMIEFLRPALRGRAARAEVSPRAEGG